MLHSNQRVLFIHACVVKWWLFRVSDVVFPKPIIHFNRYKRLKDLAAVMVWFIQYCQVFERFGGESFKKLNKILSDALNNFLGHLGKKS